MLVSFFTLLPRAPLQIVRQRELNTGNTSPEDQGEANTSETAGLLDQAEVQAKSRSSSQTPYQRAVSELRAKLSRATSLVVPYMIPLFLVYLAEYTINQAVAPTLLFPLEQSPFAQYRAFYPTYGALYQTGVFVSRSSLALFQIRALYTPTILQIMNLIVLTAHAIHPFLPNVYFVFAIVLWEGLLGGLVYVSTYARVRDDVAEEDREFSLGAVSVSDSAGICLAGFLGMVIELALCNWQVEHGRDWCRKL